jgi:Ca2+-binding EF-hand superfamily protein
MARQVDQDNSGEIDFQEFLTVIAHHKALTAKDSGEQDTLNAFVALGGNVRQLLDAAVLLWHAVLRKMQHAVHDPMHTPHMQHRP